MKLLQLKLQATDTDGRSQIFCLLITAHTGYGGLSIGENTANGGYAYKITVIINTKGFILGVCISGSLRKFLGTLCSHGQSHHIFHVAHFVLTALCDCFLHVRTFNFNGTVRKQFINGLIQRISALALTGVGIIFISFRIRLRNKIQCTGPSQILKNCICILHAGNFNIDSICSLLVNNRFCTVIFHTLLKLGHRILHIGFIGSFLTHHLIGNADTAGQIQTQLNVRRTAASLGIDTIYINIGYSP